jgi:integrase
MPSTTLLDACGRRRSPATLSSFHQGRAPRNKGQRYPADPPTVEEIIAVMHAAGDDHDAVRSCGLTVVLWRAGLRISEALTLNESDLDLHRGAILIRDGKAASAERSGWTAGRRSSWPRGCSYAPRSSSTAHQARKGSPSRTSPTPGSNIGMSPRRPRRRCGLGERFRGKGIVSQRRPA